MSNNLIELKFDKSSQEFYLSRIRDIQAGEHYDFAQAPLWSIDFKNTAGQIIAVNSQGTPAYTLNTASNPKTLALAWSNVPIGSTASSIPSVSVEISLADNSMESLWSNTKRGIDGVHHSVSPKYLQHYLDSYTFRYNHRNDKQPLFVTMLLQVKKSLPSDG